MDKFLKRPKAEIVGVFEEVSARLELQSHIIEKDFWVCWTLLKLYSIPEFMSTIIFKGGTSLSKAYGVIERLSEDIDLTIDKTVLGDLKDPTENGISGKEQSRRIDALVNSAENYVATQLLSRLNEVIGQSLNDKNWKLEIDEYDKQTILFYYPQAIVINEKSYIKPVIRLELGARGGIIPKEDKVICSYVADIFPNLFEFKGCAVPTLSIERTFWEKITILHSLYNRHQKGKAIGHRMSRHYYDIYMLAKQGIAITAVAQKELLEEVIKNNIVFFKDPNSAYETAKLGELKLAPSEEMLMALKQDYKEMEVMMIGNYPSFDDILKVIKDLEMKLNNLNS